MLWVGTYLASKRLLQVKAPRPLGWAARLCGPVSDSAQRPRTTSAALVSLLLYSVRSMLGDCARHLGTLPAMTHFSGPLVRRRHHFPDIGLHLDILGSTCR